MKHLFLIALCALSCHQLNAENTVKVYVNQSTGALYSDVAAEFIQQVKSKPTSVFLLPTGATPEPLYVEIIKQFKADKTLDLSQARFFNLDEYVGLAKDHPLSYSFYMHQNFYSKLGNIDINRAPQVKNIHILHVEKNGTPATAIKEYMTALKGAGPIDIAFLGIGGIAPFKTKHGHIYKGGHLAFNEFGTPPNATTHVVTLTDKTRADTQFRFDDLKKDIATTGPTVFKTDVPTHAMTVGMKEILSSKKIIMMVTGAHKSKVVEETFKQANNINIPASFLLSHSATSWFIGGDASRPRKG